MKRSNTEPTVKLYLLPVLGKRYKTFIVRQFQLTVNYTIHKAINMDLLNMIRNFSKFNSDQRSMLHNFLFVS